jgi:hypothetical protein
MSIVVYTVQMSEVDITFYTHPSTYINEYFDWLSTPYDRVAGLRAFDQDLWAKRSLLPAENSYHPTDTEAVTYTLPENLAYSIMDYFYDFYTSPPTLYQLGDPIKNREERSNCHRFGATMLGGTPQTFYGGLSIATGLLRQKILLAEGEYQPIGSAAILGTASETLWGLKGGFAEHTMVSLGNAAPGLYIHTLALAGNIGLSALAPLLSKHKGFYPDAEAFYAPASPGIRPNWHLTDLLQRYLT